MTLRGLVLNQDGAKLALPDVLVIDFDLLADDGFYLAGFAWPLHSCNIDTYTRSEKKRRRRSSGDVKPTSHFGNTRSSKISPNSTAPSSHTADAFQRHLI